MLDSITDHDVANASSRTSTIQYDATGIFPTAVVNPMGHAVQMQSDGRTGRIVRAMDEACAVAEHHVDLFGRTVASFAADGSSSTFEYLRSDVLSDPEALTSPLVLHRTGGDGSEVFSYADPTGRALAEDVRSFDDDFVRSEVELDALGRISRTLTPRRAIPLRVADKSTTTFFEREYDNLNRLRWLRRPGDSAPSSPVDTWEYPSLEERRHTDRAGRVTTYTHNTAGELIAIERNGRTTAITYDPLGLPSRIEAPGFTETRAYDGLGRLLAMSNTDRGAFSYGYDAYGRMRTEVTPAQFTRVVTYDALDRPSSLLHELGTDQFTWDVQYDGTLSSTLSSDGTSTLYGYDSLGRLDSETITGDGETRSVHLAYDAIGQLSRLSYPATPGGYQFEIAYSYHRGALRDIIDVGRERKLWSTLAHDLHGRTTDYQLGADEDALTVVSGYDDAFGRLKSLEAYRANAPTVKVLNQHHTLYPDGRLKQRQDISQDPGGALNRVEDYTYDAFGRLETWELNRDGGPVDLERRYVYDPQLMRLNRVEDTLGGASSPSSVEQYAYADLAGRPNRLLSVGGPGYAMQYDDLGRMTSRERGGGLGPDDLNISRHTYHDLPQRGDVGGTGFDIGYTVDGTRAKVEWGSGTSTHYHGKLTEIRRVPGKTTYVHRVYGEHGVAAQVEVLSTAKSGEEPDISYVVNDHLGSPAIVETPGNINVSRQFFEPHGRRVADDGAPLLPGQDGGVTEGLTGHEHNLELGLTNMLGRTYDPALRRFTSPDPVLDGMMAGLGIDLYRHVSNDPANRVDPNGFDDGYGGSVNGEAAPVLGGAISGDPGQDPGPDPYAAGYDDPGPPGYGDGAGDWGGQPDPGMSHAPGYGDAFVPAPGAPPAPGNGASAPTPPTGAELLDQYCAVRTCGVFGPLGPAPFQAEFNDAQRRAGEMLGLRSRVAQDGLVDSVVEAARGQELKVRMVIAIIIPPALLPRLFRSPAARGTAARGAGEVTAAEIRAINRSLGGTTELTANAETVIANMVYREGATARAATAIRYIAGRHLFDDANKRTAQAVAERLLGSGANPSQIRSVIDQVATGGLRTVEDIAAAIGP